MFAFEPTVEGSYRYSLEFVVVFESVLVKLKGSLVSWTNIDCALIVSKFVSENVNWTHFFVDSSSEFCEALFVIVLGVVY
jgi:hypothetical protein